MRKRPLIRTPRKWTRFKDRCFLIRNRKDLIALTCKVHESCGDFASCSFLGAKLYLLSDPDAIESVLHTNQENYVFGEPDWSPFVRALGRGLLYADGDSYRRQRQLVQPAFQPRKIAAYACTVVDVIRDLERRWEKCNGATIDIHQEMMNLTLTVVARVIFSDTIRAGISRIGELSTQILLLSTELYFQPAGRFPWLPTPKQAKLKRLIREYDGIIYEAIRKRKAERAKGNDLLSMLLQGRTGAPDSAEHARALSDKDVRDLAVALLSAGHETTANMLAWAWYLLAKNPEVRERLQSELRSVLGGRLATFEDMSRLPYTGQVLNETLRMYPPVWIIPRRAIKADVIQGYHVPAGARIFVSPYIVHRDPRWFSDPDRFDPSRFDSDKEAIRPKCSYLPFGAGRRRCVGQPFAEMMGRLVIAGLAQRFSPRAGANTTVEPDASFFRPKGGLKMQMIRLSS